MIGALPPALNDAPLVRDWLRLEEGRATLLTGRVELGQGAVTAIVAIAAAELGLDPEAIDVVSGDTDRTPNEGFTVGSMSISQGGAAVAWAASAARLLVLAEAARRLNVAAAELSVRSGAIIHDETTTGLDFLEVGAAVDLSVATADHGDPGRMPRAAELSRIDLPDRVLGAPFVHDIGGAETLAGRVLHPPQRGARPVTLDTEALAARPGVLHVVIDGDALGVIAANQSDVDAAISWANEQAGWQQEDAKFGDLRDFLGKRLETAGDTVFEQGDADAAKGDVVEVRTSRGYIAHAAIGPAAAVACWNDGQLTVDSSTQGVFPLRGALAKAFKLDTSAITVRHRAGSGCYGHNGTDDAAADAVFLARAVPGTPVRVVWSRTDEFRAGPLGAAMATSVRITLSEGRMSGVRVRVASPPHSSRPGTAGHPCLSTPARFDPPQAFPQMPDVPPNRGGGADRNAIPLYAIPHMRVEKTLIHDLPLRTSSLRGLGTHVNVVAIERGVEAAARATGTDPVAFRLAHLDDPRARAVIERVAGDGLPAPDASGAWGLGFARYKNTAAYCAVALRLEVGERLRVTNVRVAVDTGAIISRDGTLNQIEGGLLQAISWTLLEEMPLHGSGAGAIGWEDYPILRFSDVPDDVQIELVDRPDEPSLGCAEALVGPTAAAICIAAESFMGASLPEMPLTPARILSAM